MKMPPETNPSTIEPSPPSTESLNPASLDGDVEFDGGGRDFDEASIFTDLDEVPPAAEPAQAKVPPPTPPAQPPTARPAETPAPTTAAPAPQPESEVTPEQVLQSFRAWRQNAESVLSNSHFNLT